MNRFFTPYYILNILLLLSYPIFRLYLTRTYNLKQLDTFGYTRESGIFFTACAGLWVQWKKSATIEHFLSNIFLWGKLCLLVTFSLVEIRYGLYFLSACIGIGIKNFLILMDISNVVVLQTTKIPWKV